MDDTTPKVSFIPKGSLVREESFLERRRPRSVAGFIAIIAMAASIGTYAGLYLYDKNYIERDVDLLTGKIIRARQKFSATTQVGEAQLFSSRVGIAKELLNSHTVVSPIASFLAENTVSSILYDDFSFSRAGATGIPKLQLTGEAPSYASLAYQRDIFRNKKELTDFSIGNVSLTHFGTVTFSLSLTFDPAFLSYSENLRLAGMDVSLPSETSVLDTEGSTFESAAQDGSTTTQSTYEPPIQQEKAPSPEQATSTTTGVTSESFDSVATVSPAETSGMVPESNPSILRSLWQKFKFW
ncbi:MAG: hypothetical protein HZB10_00460 [Candidatus Yonathbacteria bacterium]|nr:hypothetical protein [Candidatus Yonathbacteria bacterium]